MDCCKGKKREREDTISRQESWGLRTETCRWRPGRRHTDPVAETDSSGKSQDAEGSSPQEEPTGKGCRGGVKNGRAARSHPRYQAAGGRTRSPIRRRKIAAEAYLSLISVELLAACPANELISGGTQVVLSEQGRRREAAEPSPCPTGGDAGNAPPLMSQLAVNEQIGLQ